MSTPIVDAVLMDPMAIPPGVDAWLRRIESGARERLARLEPYLAAPGVLPAVPEAHGELQQFLHDPDKGALSRVLRRPLSQLALEGVGALSFSRVTAALFERADLAAELQREADALRRLLAGVRNTFAAGFPRALERHLREACIGEDWINGARRLSDLRAQERRLARVRGLLEELAETAPVGVPPETMDSRPGSPTRAELAAQLALRLRQRSAAAEIPIPTERLRATAAAHIAALAEPGLAAASAPVHFITQELLEAVVAAPSLARLGEDVPLWGATIAAAERARFPGHPAAWQARLRPAEARPGPAVGESTYFIIPVDDEYVWITQSKLAPARVYSLAIQVGSSVECRIFSPEHRAYTSAEAELDVGPLFSGLRPEPAWYRTQSRAYVKIVTAHGEGYFGRVERRGALQKLSAPAADELVDVPGALRVLADGRAARGKSVYTVVPDGEAWAYAGAETRPVRTPVHGAERLWLRTGDRDALESEEALFLRLRQLDPRLAPGLVGWGRMTDSRSEGRLYSPPLAFRPSESVERWIRDGNHRAAAISGLARLCSRVLQSGFVLRSYHWGCLSWAPDPHDLELQPRPVLVSGILACPLGSVPRRPKRSALDALRYPRIRFRGLPPPLAAGDPTRPEHDALAFALATLELLAQRTIASPAEWIDWADLPGAIRTNAEKFSAPSLAKALARRLDEPEGAAVLLRQIPRLAGDEPDSL